MFSFGNEINWRVHGRNLVEQDSVVLLSLNHMVGLSVTIARRDGYDSFITMLTSYWNIHEQMALTNCGIKR